MKRTGPTLILMRCPFCKELVRLVKGGRFDQHPDSRLGVACTGSGEIPDPLR